MPDPIFQTFLNDSQEIKYFTRFCIICFAGYITNGNKNPIPTITAITRDA